MVKVMVKAPFPKRFKCDLCGMTFTRDGHVLAHRNKMWCVVKRRGKHGDTKRVDNLKRALENHLPSLISHLKNVVVKQNAPTTPRLVTFIPFGPCSVRTLDVGRMKEIFDAVADDRGGFRVISPASLFATASAYSMWWTTCLRWFVDSLRCPIRGLTSEDS